MQGAAELVLRRCTRAIGTDGSVISMSTALRAELEETTTGMAARGLRTLCITYRDFAAGVQRPVDFFEEAPDTDLICCAITGIKVLPTLRSHKPEFGLKSFVPSWLGHSITDTKCASCSTSGDLLPCVLQLYDADQCKPHQLYMALSDTHAKQTASATREEPKHVLVMLQLFHNTQLLVMLTWPV